MKNVLKYFVIAAGLSLLFYFCSVFMPDSGNTAENKNFLPVERIDFPDFGFMPSPSEYSGRVFRLSDKYPKGKPNQDLAVENILSIDFKTDWRKYLEAVREYVFEGNVSKDYESSFYLEDNKVRSWFHVPWQHWGPNGREGYHGLTHEGPVLEQMLAPKQTTASYAYAVGFYNDLGGYTIGKVWEDDVPNYDFLNYEDFPEGTIVAKILFVPFEEDVVPYLSNPLSWTGYIYDRDNPRSMHYLDTACQSRSATNMQLIQMDIMVKDARADLTGGWVFGNFAYNGLLDNDNRWYNLAPVGIMWGNDPEERKSTNNPKPLKTIINPNLKETIINPNNKELPPMHLGWGSRLSGPVDNPNSSCMSCHSTAQYPVVSAIMPFIPPKPIIPIPDTGSIANDAWMKWFRNVPCGTPFDPGKAVSFDYSLQLVQSVQNYIEFASKEQKGRFYEEYWSNGNKARNQ
jgi:hypothetical protein